MYDKSVDIWALAVTMFNVATLVQAFTGPDKLEVLRKVIHAQHDQITGPCSDDLKAIIHGMLNIKPAERPSSGEMLRHRYFASLIDGGALAPSALRHRSAPGTTTPEHTYPPHPLSVLE